MNTNTTNVSDIFGTSNKTDKLDTIDKSETIDKLDTIDKLNTIDKSDTTDELFKWNITPTTSTSLIFSNDNDADDILSKQNNTLNNLYYNSISSKNEKKWIIALIFSTIIILIYSTFTVRLIEKLLFNHGIELYNSNRHNEILFCIIQFTLILILLRFLLSYL